MNDSDDRLRRADPVAGQPYHHANIGQMISRITTARSSSHERQWRLFKLRMASAVALASALTVGAVS